MAFFTPNAPQKIFGGGYEWFSLDDYFEKENIYIWINDSVGFNTKETLDSYISCYLSLSSNCIKLSTRKHVDSVEDDYNYSCSELGDIDDSNHEEDNIEDLFMTDTHQFMLFFTKSVASIQS